MENVEKVWHDLPPTVFISAMCGCLCCRLAMCDVRKFGIERWTRQLLKWLHLATVAEPSKQIEDGKSKSVPATEPWVGGSWWANCGGSQPGYVNTGTIWAALRVSSVVG
jgi:hypothetical protein